MIQTMENMKDMMEMLETMKELFPEGFSGNGENMDISQMAEMFSAFGGGIFPQRCHGHSLKTNKEGTLPRGREHNITD